jgi:hypothetical protein
MIGETLMIATRTERGSREPDWSFFHFVPARYTARRVTASQSVSNPIDQGKSPFCNNSITVLTRFHRVAMRR